MAIEKVRVNMTIKSDINFLSHSPEDDKNWGKFEWIRYAVQSLPNSANILLVGECDSEIFSSIISACENTDRLVYPTDLSKDICEKNLSLKNLSNLGMHLRFFDQSEQSISKNLDGRIDFIFLSKNLTYEEIDSYFGLLKNFSSRCFVVLDGVEPNSKGSFEYWHKCVKFNLDNTAQFFSLAFGVANIKKKFDGIVHVIIPVHNRLEYTKICLLKLVSSSIIKQIKIYIVDDGSSDGTAAYIAQNYPEITIIQGDGNLFWTGAVHKALEYIKFRPEDFFCLINNDSLVSYETIEVLVETALDREKLCVAPTCFNGSEAEATGWGPGTAPILNNFQLQLSQIGLKGLSIKVESIFGRCSLFPANILTNVGNYDIENFIHYHGDTDFCLRAQKYGFEFEVTAKTTISSIVSTETTGSHHKFRRSPQNIYRVWENMTSVRSIDNVLRMYKFSKRHNKDRKLRATIRTAWASLRQWTPIYRTRQLKRIILGQRKLIEGKLDG